MPLPFKDNTMAKIPDTLAMLDIEKVLETTPIPPSYPRPYLGLSQAGHKCPRFLWYSFRWAFKEKIDQRKRRIFERGDLEEDRVINDLKDAGYTVRARQTPIIINRHVMGHCDGIVEGIPDSSRAHLLEIKTMKDSSFRDLVKNKLQQSNHVYWCQAHLYMYYLDLTRCLFICTNKDNEERYYERIKVDRDLAEYLVDRATDIVFSNEPPPKLNQNPSWYECKFCPAADVCHYEQKPERNCRTCEYANLHHPEGAMYELHCEQHSRRFLTEKQAEGCDRYSLLTSLSSTSD